MRRKLAIFRSLHRAAEVVRCARETKQWFPITLAYLGFKDLAYPCSLQLRDLRPIYLKEVSDVWAFWQIFLRRVYPLEGSEELIVDAGANIGFFTLLAARQAPRAKLISVEPFPESYERLMENVRNNQLGDRVRCLNYALGGDSERRMMRLGGKRSQARRVIAFHPKKDQDTAPVPTTTVPTTTLEQVFEEQSITSVDLLKMDIEGSEYEVLFSTPARVLRRIRHICLEYHPDVPDYTPAQMLRYLQQVGFTVIRDMRNSKGFGIALLALNREQAGDLAA
jgi:FkbM family methyltransferase